MTTRGDYTQAFTWPEKKEVFVPDKKVSDMDPGYKRVFMCGWKYHVAINHNGRWLGWDLKTIEEMKEHG